MKKCYLFYTDYFNNTYDKCDDIKRMDYFNDQSLALLILIAQIIQYFIKILSSELFINFHKKE